MLIFTVVDKRRKLTDVVCMNEMKENKTNKKYCMCYACRLNVRSVFSNTSCRSSDCFASIIARLKLVQ